MGKYLITQSLLSSWAYLFDCSEGFEDDAMADFLASLRREKKPPTEAMLNGIGFENLVYSIADGSFRPKCELDVGTNPVSGESYEHNTYPRWHAGASQIAEIIKGAPIQVKAQREIEIEGETFLVYGILDALKAGTIYDVKFLNKRFGSADLAGKYLESAQHPAYFYIVPEATEFQYLVSDGEDVYIERYRREETPFIGDIIRQFIESIHSLRLLDIYKEHWAI